MRPYELLARFDASGNVSGVSVRTLVTIDGRDYESDPSPLIGASDPAFTAFAAAFSAAIVAQRDQLLSDKSALETQLSILTTERDGLQTQLATITAECNTLFADLSVAKSDIMRVTGERDSVTTQRDTATQRIIELEAQLDALLHPVVNPRHLAPFDFLALLTHNEIHSMQTSVDPTVIVGRTKLQTIITFVDLDHQTTIDLVRYMETAGLLAEGRADQILAGEPPTQ